jgi:fido (protein-threonine AMPylation protein)
LSEKFAERAAYYLDLYKHTHVFRGGNGRKLQAAFTQLGKEAGYQVKFSRIDPATLEPGPRRGHGALARSPRCSAESTAAQGDVSTDY